MYIKSNVNLAGACFEIGWACAIAADLHYEIFQTPLVITSVKDSQHHVRSLHYVGRAADLRTRDLSAQQKQRFYGELVKALDSHGFDVVLEADHIHVEFDPKAGERFAEVTA